MKETFIIRTEWMDSIMELDPLDRATIFGNLFYFHSDNENLINLTNLPVKLVWKFIEPNLKRNATSYDKRCETSKLNGALGGRPPKEPPIKKDENEKPNKPNNLPVTLSDSDIDSELGIDPVPDSDFESDIDKKNALKKKQKKVQQSQTAIAPAMTAILKPEKFVVPKGNWDLFVTIYNDFLKGRGLPEIIRHPVRGGDEYTIQAKDLHDLKLIYEKLFPLCKENHLLVTQSFQVMFEKWHLLNKFTQDFIQPGQIYSQLTNIIDQLKNFKSRNMTDSQKKSEEVWNNVDMSKLLNNK